MFRKLMITALALAILAPAVAASAQEGSQVGELIVTAERRASDVQRVPVAVSAYTGASSDGSQPHVVLFRRADNLITYVQVDCDTRDASDRLSEFEATVRGMIAAAAQSDGTIELSIEAEDAGVLIPLKPEAIAGLLKPGPRPDSSTALIIVKTHIAPTDTFEAATGRIEAFVKKTKVVGRSLVARTGDWQLTLITPRQYRPAIVALIAKDAAETARAVGTGYGVTLTGLEQPVAWSRSGALELALYIPYAMTVGPMPAH